MKLWLVKRTDGIDYDEFVSFVVRAENKKKALNICKYESNKYNWREATFRDDNTEIIELTTDGEEEMIMDSFNAG